MSLMRMNYRSQLLGKFVDISIVFPTDRMTLPERLMPDAYRYHAVDNVRNFEYKPGMKYQTIYLIHGGGDDDTLVYRYSNAERYAQENCVMLVTPNIANSFGVDTEYGVNYQSFLTKELPWLVQTLFPSSPKREDNFIMGYAMGGNVALGTALMHPELYAGCCDMSGGIGLTLDTDRFMEELRSDHFAHGFKLYPATFGNGDLHGTRFDMMKAAKDAIAGGIPVPVRMVCGGDEFILGRVENDVRLLKEIGYPVEYICDPGYTHDFPIWEKHIPLAMSEFFTLKRRPIYEDEQ